MGAKSKVGEKIVEEYWGTTNEPFDISFILKHVGTLPEVLPLKITQVVLKLVGLEKARGENLYCDFEGQVLSTTKSYELKPGKEIKLFCNFVADEQGIGIIEVEYSYDYKYLRSEAFTVKAKRQETS